MNNNSKRNTCSAKMYVIQWTDAFEDESIAMEAAKNYFRKHPDIPMDN